AAKPRAGLVMVEPSLHHTGVGLVAFVQLLEYAFSEFPLRKVYVEATTDAVGQYASSVGRGFLQTEGVLAGHQWNGYGFSDVVIASIWRDRFQNSAERLRWIERGRLRVARQR
ncbi:MAG: hypothetical protein KDB17_07325, partial [Ilumatobacter sp.]|nr:hypothetical protein [Ilumatobacter sp.]